MEEQERSTPIIESLMAIGVLVVVVIGAMWFINATVPQKPAPTPTPTQVVVLPPTPTGTATPRPTLTATPLPKTYADLESAQKDVGFPLVRPGAIPTGTRILRIEVRPDSFGRYIVLFYASSNGEILEFWQSDPNYERVESTRYYFSDPSFARNTIIGVNGEQGMYENVGSGLIGLRWIQKDRVYLLRDTGWRLPAAELLKIAESVK